MRTASGADITICGNVMRKVHRRGTDPELLARRLRIAARLGADPSGCLLAPLSTDPEPVSSSDGMRWRTRWPRIEPVAPDTAFFPWVAAGGLLARLHGEVVDSADNGLDHAAPQRLQRALEALPVSSSARGLTIARAARSLPSEAWRPDSVGRPLTLVHGDWHLGQLGRRPATAASVVGSWTLMDIDDLGLGDPVWDLARPAGFWAAGLLSDADWHLFLDAYRDADGLALPPAPADPWTVLEPFARAAVIQAAARGEVRRNAEEPDPVDEALLRACAGMPG